ncbi:pyridoxal phosphate-dependent decarboxylase family protein [Alteribacter aurantiacus]|uniref:pyridoxal phosphate-dependent decarboxylase family protein n=1 Tax=Alteribacter aurantiacus TaxID=254410 RepID=UPI00047878E4|nr:pyridoxal-dependent decarboxylase [Alteribacter aurantiacus]
MTEVQQLFPSVDGNEMDRGQLLEHIHYILTEIDALKNPEKLTLGTMPKYDQSYYQSLTVKASIPESGFSIDHTMKELLDMSQGHRFVNRNYVANAAPLPNTASILGNFMMVLLNGNNLWDVEGPTAAAAEVKTVSMLSKIAGYDPLLSGGFTTWGGQGAVFQSLRLAISRQFPTSNQTGTPPNLYCFASELSHYSLYKSVEATGIGTNNLIRIKVNEDFSMDLIDLEQKMEEVILNGGNPFYVLATMGTTDTFAIDDIQGVKDVTMRLAKKHPISPAYIHADSAMGGMYTFFNQYDFKSNPLSFSDTTSGVLKGYQLKMKAIHVADSMVYDFHKLGQTPYISSVFLVKNKFDLQYLNIGEEETPYVGNRAFGTYHTGYTLECSRMGSSITIYASLLALGMKGYQTLLAHYIDVNIAFRQALTDTFPSVAITNSISPITTFRFYEADPMWSFERHGGLTMEKMNEINLFNEKLSDQFGENRDDIYFGSTKKQCLVQASDSTSVPIFAHKFFAISPYTTVKDIHVYMHFLKEHHDNVVKMNVIV